MIRKPEKSDVLYSYLTKNINKGYSRESLKWALVKQGHSRIEIEKAFKRLDEDLERESAKMKAQESIQTINESPAVEVPAPQEQKSFWAKIIRLARYF